MFFKENKNPMNIYSLNFFLLIFLLKICNQIHISNPDVSRQVRIQSTPDQIHIELK
jgi:hypothetical protein